jgi:hypothetical protein
MVYKNNKKGIGLVEVVVGTAILLGITLSVISAHSLFVRTVFANTAKIKASLLLEEGIEVVRLLRDSDWDLSIGSLGTDTTYGLNQTDVQWSIISSPEYIDNKFERTFTISNVYRDANDDIAVSGVLDPYTKFITFSVSWNIRGATTTKTMSAYFSNIF